MAQLFAGTSGFAYTAWKPDFYPQKVASKDFLKYYATRLNAVEINYTFRQLPKAATLGRSLGRVSGASVILWIFGWRWRWRGRRRRCGTGRNGT